MNISPILSVLHVSKVYQNGSGVLTVLSDISFSLAAGATCAIVGPSGSGKTTLLGLCAGLDRPTSGSVILHDRQLDALSEDELATVRNTSVGFVFQSFHLIPTLTAVENVMVPVELRGDKRAKALAVELLHRVGLADRLHHYPVQLSGGEQQRVALARAFINQPRILFADEPTGNLDAETSEKVMRLLFELNTQVGTALVLVTHNSDLARQTQRIIRLQGGKIITEEEPENRGIGEPGKRRAGGSGEKRIEESENLQKSL
jgi:putative ABC transport system ATP-binding protein